MRTITKEFKIFKCDELSDEIKNKIICDEVDFIVEVETYDVFDDNGIVKPQYRNSNLYKAIKEADAMHTPWFIGNYILDYCRERIMETINSREYYETGDVFID